MIATLGKVRQGSGILIGDDGLVLTIGYLILEADQVDLVAGDGRRIPARVVAYDLASGVGLVQALAPLGIAPVPLGVSARIAGDEPLLFASGGDERDLLALSRIVLRRAFSGYWEYHIDGAIFTAQIDWIAAAPASSTPTASWSASARSWSATPRATMAPACAATCSFWSTC